MSIEKKVTQRVIRRAQRVRSKINRDCSKLRVSVFRSLTNIYAQIIDDAAGKTLVSCSSLELKNLKGDKKSVAHTVGLELAKRAVDKGLTVGVFDRGPFLFHGRVKSLVDGLREGGFKI